MANIEPKKTKDGRIYFVINVYLGRDQEGNKIRKKTSFWPASSAATKARKEAEAFAAEYENQLKSGDMLCDEGITFAEFKEIWEKNWLTGKTPGVQENYKRYLRVHVLPVIGHLKLTSIRATHIDKILNDKKRTKAPRTVRMIYVVTNSVFRYAVKKQYIRDNPCLHCDDLPSVETKRGDDLSFFDEDQTRRFLNEALTMEYTFHVRERHRKDRSGTVYSVKAYDEHRPVHLMWRAYFTLAIFSMMRRGEMCGLTWRDIDFERYTVNVNKALASTKELGQYIKDPKTKAGIREFYLPEEVIYLLKRWKHEQSVLCAKLGSSWMGHKNGKKEDGTMDSFEDNNIFIQLDSGLPIHLSTPGHKFREIVDLYNAACQEEEDKLPYIRLHDLRHTGATLLIGKNVDVEVVAKRLGHSKPSVTLDIYGHALPENDKKAVDILRHLFGGN